MSTRIVYDDDHLRALFHPGVGDDLLITFNGADTRVNGLTFWGEGFVSKTQTPTLGVVSRQPNWFPQASMRKLADMVSAITSPFRSRTGYGFSMGAYAVLKYGRLLSIDDALSLSPQFSLDPAEVAQHDKRFIKHFDAALHDGMSIRTEDMPRRAFIFYDPLHAVDVWNVDRILAATQGASVELVTMIGLRHNTIRAFTRTSLAMRLIAAAREPRRERSLTQIRAVGADGRRQNAFRFTDVMTTAFERRLETGLKMLRANRHTLSDKELNAILDHGSAYLMRNRRFLEALSFCAEALVLQPGNARLMLRMADILSRASLPGAAKAWLDRSLAINPNDRQVADLARKTDERLGILAPA